MKTNVDDIPLRWNQPLLISLSAENNIDNFHQNDTKCKTLKTKCNHLQPCSSKKKKKLAELIYTT